MEKIKTRIVERGCVLRSPSLWSWTYGTRDETGTSDPVTDRMSTMSYLSSVCFLVH